MTGGVEFKFVSSSTVLARSFSGRFRKLFPFGGVRYDGAGCRNLIYLDLFLNRHPSEMLDNTRFRLCVFCLWRSVFSLSLLLTLIRVLYLLHTKMTTDEKVKVKQNKNDGCPFR